MTTRAQMAARQICLDRNDENIIQPFDKQVDVKQINDSDSSSLSSTMSTEGTVEREQLSHQSRPAIQGNNLLLPDDDEPSEETIITASFHIWTERHKHLPKVFDKTGRLRTPYGHLKAKISAATEQRKRQVAADKQLQQVHSLLEPPVGFPAGFNTSASQATSKDPQRVTTEKSQISSQTGDPNLSSPHQLSDVLDGSSSHSRLDKKLDLDGSTPQVNNSLPTMAALSTQTKKQCSNPSTYRRGKNTLSHPRKAQRVAGQEHPGKSLRSGLPPNLAEQEASQSLPKTNVTQDQSNAHRIQAYPKVLYSPSSTSSLTSPEGIAKSQCPERNIDHPLEAKRQISNQPQTPRTEPILPSPSPSAREQAIAARVLHERIQQQQSRNSESCNNCSKNSCSCNPNRQPIEKILCSDDDCFRKWWGVDELQKYCGIKLSDARETKRNFNCWFCPECSNKARVLLNAIPTRAPLSPSRDSRTMVPDASGHPGPEDCAWPEDAEIREPLQALTGILQQYTGTTTMSRNHLSQMDPHTSILDIPCIRGETLQSAGAAHNVIYVLRQLLNVPEGVLIRNIVTETKLQHISCSVCIRAILSYLITDFIFNAGSPFEDTTLWSKVLTDSGHSSHQAGSLIHNYRIRLMKAHETNPEDPHIPPEFRERLYRRRQTFMELLNVTMLPLVGGDSDVQARHKKIAKIASELNLKVFAYRGTFVQIYPHIKEPFDLEYHTEENPELEDLAGQPILLTTMLGIKYEHPEKGWRTYSPAKTKVWPANNTLRHRAARVSLPDMPRGNPPNQPTRIVPKKRRAGDAT